MHNRIWYLICLPEKQNIKLKTRSAFDLMSTIFISVLQLNF